MKLKIGIMATYNNKHISFKINDFVNLSGFHDIIKKNSEISPTQMILNSLYLMTTLKNMFVAVTGSANSLFLTLALKQINLTGIWLLQGENDSTIREHTEFLKLEFKKLRSKLDEFNSSMTATLSADRRQKIVVDHSPMLKSLKPGLGSKMNMSYFRNLLQLPIYSERVSNKLVQHKYVSRHSETVEDVIEKIEEIRDAEEKDERRDARDIARRELSFADSENFSVELEKTHFIQFIL
ncbi:hypothetical protein Avbf_09578 [Armadillidium vulgare]|nr:hypothetical protein Avbf_09578 [Armadillidium vulgare]